jgi:transcriptional regulator with XRE-family HTH domain
MGMDALGTYFATLRGSKSRAKLAAEAGISEMSILRIEVQNQEPKAEALVALVGALKARWEDVEYLLKHAKSADEGRQLAEQVQEQLRQAESEDERHQVLQRLIADLEANPQKLDQLIGYGARLLEEDRRREGH